MYGIYWESNFSLALFFRKKNMPNTSWHLFHPGNQTHLQSPRTPFFYVCSNCFYLWNFRLYLFRFGPVGLQASLKNPCDPCHPCCRWWGILFLFVPSTGRFPFPVSDRSFAWRYCPAHPGCCSCGCCCFCFRLCSGCLSFWSCWCCCCTCSGQHRPWTRNLTDHTICISQTCCALCQSPLFLVSLCIFAFYPLSWRSRPAKWLVWWMEHQHRPQHRLQFSCFYYSTHGAFQAWWKMTCVLRLRSWRLELLIPVHLMCKWIERLML